MQRVMNYRIYAGCLMFSYSLIKASRLQMIGRRDEPHQMKEREGAVSLATRASSIHLLPVDQARSLQALTDSRRAKASRIGSMLIHNFSSG